MDTFSDYLKLINNCDPSDPLLSSTPLGKRVEKIPLDCLNSSELIDLTQSLNLEQLIPTEAGLARDYRGLAELMGFSSIEIETRFKRSYNPTKSLIDAFINKNLTSTVQGRSQPTLNDLLKMIEHIERFDVLDDFLPTLVKLASTSANSFGDFSGRQQPKQQALKHHDESHQHHHHSRDPDHLVMRDRFDRLTVDDTFNARTLYDAFICYAPEDIHYAQELMYLLQAHGGRVATADDLLPGHFEHDALVRLIDVRCRKFISILTPNFLRSKECEFQTKFANEIGIKDESPKIIPVLYEACDDSLLPAMIKVLSKIDMTNRTSRRWQMKRLVSSLTLESTPTSNTLGSAQIAITAATEAARLVSDYNNAQNNNNSPAITFTNTQPTRSITNGEPIVELLYSQSSVSGGPMNRQPSVKKKTGSTTTNNTRNWFQTAGSKLRRVLGSSSSSDESISACTSSQALLITTTSGDLPSDEIIGDK